MTYFGERGGLKLPQVYASPDNRWFFYQTRRGDLATDSNIERLLVFNTRKVSEALRTEVRVAPSYEVSLSSSSNYSAINGARWTEDGKSIVFLGAEGDGAPQVYRFDLAAGERSRITNAENGVGSFEYRAGAVIFSTRANMRAVLPATRTYPANTISLRQFNAATSRADEDYDIATFVSYGAALPKHVGPDYTSYGRASSPRYWVSPDGRRAFMSIRLLSSEMPPEWSRYRGGNLRCLYEVGALYLVDMRTGEMSLALDYPIENSARKNGGEVLWASDSKHAVIANAAVAADSKAGCNSLAVIDFNAVKHTWQVLQHLPVVPNQEDGRNTNYATVMWGTSEREVDVEALQGGVPVTTKFRYRGSGWCPAGTKRGPLTNAPITRDVYGGYSSNGEAIVLGETGIRVGIEQGLNTPPAAVARLDNRAIRLSDVDSVIQGVSRTQIQRRQWTAASGRTVCGGLFMPSRNGRSGRMPLVIQTYDFVNNQFLPDGFAPLSAYAAQPLASHDIAVFQLARPAGV